MEKILKGAKTILGQRVIIRKGKTLNVAIFNKQSSQHFASTFKQINYFLFPLKL